MHHLKCKKFSKTDLLTDFLLNLTSIPATIHQQLPIAFTYSRQNYNPIN